MEPSTTKITPHPSLITFEPSFRLSSAPHDARLLTSVASRPRTFSKGLIPFQVIVSLRGFSNRHHCTRTEPHHGCSHGQAHGHGDKDEEASCARASNQCQWSQAHRPLRFALQCAQDSAWPEPDSHLRNSHDKWRSPKQSPTPATDHEKQHGGQWSPREATCQEIPGALWCVLIIADRSQTGY